MKMCSLFDGSGGFPLAGALCGIEPVIASEVEPYPIAVTRSRFPTMKHLGDVSKVSGSDIEPVDLITFGSPCQDLSVAGKRAGLKHEENGDEETTRSGLFMEAIRIIKEMRGATNGQYPTFALWENVPGAFSSNKGEDFRVVLEEFIKIKEPSATVPAAGKNGWPYADIYVGDGWSVAYRTFDAQYWGVPQRRRRIYLVADFRGERAGKILFERESLRRYNQAGGTQGQGTASDAQNGSGTADPERNSLTTEKPQNESLSHSEWHYFEDQNGQMALSNIIAHTEERNPYTLKIRSGVEIDSAGKKAGKGALIQENMSMTLGTSQDQYLFQPVKGGFVLDDQGGQQITVRDDGKSPTLRAEAHGNVPCVMQSTAYSFDSLSSNSMKSKNPQSGCREVDVSKTLDTTDPNPSKNQGGIAIVQAYSVENHPNDSRVKIDEDGKVQALTSRMGTGGGNVPMVMEEKLKIINLNKDDVQSKAILDPSGIAPSLYAGECRGGGGECYVMEPVVCLQGNGIDRADTAGCNGKGWKEDICYTLNTIDRPAVALSIGNGQPNNISMSEVSNTLDCMHDKQAVLTYGIDRAAFNQSQNAKYGFSITEEQSPTLVAKGPNAVCSGVDCRNLADTGDVFQTICAKPNGGYSLNYSGAVVEETETQYIVRRLTPTECCRLQGFPDGWGKIDPKEDFTDEEFAFWHEVRNTHAAINGRKLGVYNKKSMLTWYNKLHTDSAEYKMWGNGIALPTAQFVMEGIADELEAQEREHHG